MKLTNASYVIPRGDYFKKQNEIQNHTNSVMELGNQCIIRPRHTAKKAKILQKDFTHEEKKPTGI